MFEASPWDLQLPLLFTMLLGCFVSFMSPSLASTETARYLCGSYTTGKELHLVLVQKLPLPSSLLL